MDLLEKYAPLLSAESEQDWCESLLAFGANKGFDYTLFALIHTLSTGFEKAYLRSNYAECWRESYDRQRMAHIDPTVAHCLSNNVPLIWSPSIFRTLEQKQMYEEASGVGLHTGVTLPIHGPKGEVGMLCFVTSRCPSEALWKDIGHQLAELTLLRDMACDSGQKFACPQYGKSTPTLTKRERECLKWTAIGKSSWEIAQILHCSEATINFHIKNVRQKFGASSRRAAAVKAATLGLLGPL